MKRHVLEIASDARTLEEKLNSLGDHLVLETMVWANGKLLVVVRECSPRAAQSEPPKHEVPRHRRRRGEKDRERRLPRVGDPLAKNV